MALPGARANRTRAQRTERWRPRRLAWLRLAASPAISRISLVIKRRFLRRLVIRRMSRLRRTGSGTQPSQPARTPALRYGGFAADAVSLSVAVLANNSQSMRSRNYVLIRLKTPFHLTLWCRLVRSNSIDDVAEGGGTVWTVYLLSETLIGRLWPITAIAARGREMRKRLSL
jgi:hypothetical protein